MRGNFFCTFVHIIVYYNIGKKIHLNYQLSNLVEIKHQIEQVVLKMYVAKVVFIYINKIVF